MLSLPELADHIGLLGYRELVCAEEVGYNTRWKARLFSTVVWQQFCPLRDVKTAREPDFAEAQNLIPGVYRPTAPQSLSLAIRYDEQHVDE